MTSRIGFAVEWPGGEPHPARTRFDPRQRRRALVALCGTSFLLSVDTSLHSIAVPTLLQQLGDKPVLDASQWIPKVYVLAFVALLVAGGVLADRFGGKRVLAGGYVLFIVALLAHVPLQMTQFPLAIARVLMGVGVAAAVPASLVILTVMSEPGPERARAVTLWAGFCGAGVTIVPLISGFVLHGVLWTVVAVAIGTAALVLLLAVVLLVPSIPARPSAPLSARTRLATVTTTLACVIGAFALFQMPEWGWADPAVAVPLVVAFLLWAASARIRSGGHMPHDCLVRTRTQGRMAVLGLAAAIMALFGIVFLIVQYLQAVEGDPLVAGAIVFLPSCGAAVLGAKLGPAVRRRYGVVAALVGGLTAILDGLAIGLTAGTAGELGPIVAMVTAVCVGFGMLISVGLDVMSAGLPPSGFGMAWAAPTTFVQLGGLVGLAAVGSFADRGYRARLMLPSSLPAPDGAAVSRDSLGKGLAAVASADDTVGVRLADALASAFLAGYRHGLLATMAIVVAAIAVILVAAARMLRSRERGGVPRVR